MLNISNPELIHLLACPDCKNDLFEINDQLKCISCNKEYKVKNGIPLLYPRNMDFVHLQEEEKLAIGTIAIDAFFSPVSKVSYSIENMRVGDRTDYNRLKLEIETDGTISPSAALHKSGNILLDHFKTISDLSVQEFDRVDSVKEVKKTAKKTTKKSKAE